MYVNICICTYTYTHTYIDKGVWGNELDQHNSAFLSGEAWWETQTLTFDLQLALKSKLPLILKALWLCVMIVPTTKTPTSKPHHCNQHLITCATHEQQSVAHCSSQERQWDYEIWSTCHWTHLGIVSRIAAHSCCPQPGWRGSLCCSMTAPAGQ